jgi:23S rRNA (adenine2503-C2)-methyltransferase
MKIIAKSGNPDLAVVYLAKTDSGKAIEFVESLQPPFPREEKWVLIVSSLFGCPVHCKMCDAGGMYSGKLSAAEILWQIDYLVNQRFPERKIPCKKFKIQFARMGEPALNPAVLDVLKELPNIYPSAALLPSVSTVAPTNCGTFFQELFEIKNNLYDNGRFQMQFSIHTTDEQQRRQLVPIKTWSFEEIATYGEKFFQPNDRKITLNFALAADSALDPQILKKYFNPNMFLIKITPLNPTINADKNGLQSFIRENCEDEHKVVELVNKLREEKYEVLMSIGEYEENKIGSNCGQYLKRYLQSQQPLNDAYQYNIAWEKDSNDADLV